MKIVVTGSVAYDYLMSFPGKIHEQFIEGSLENISLSFLVDSMKRQRGGVAANIAYTMGLLGSKPSVLAAVGEDFESYRRMLEGHGVDTQPMIVIEDDYCASFFCTTDTMQNQIASFYPGAMAHAHTLSLADHAADAELVIISPNDPVAMTNYAEECRQSGTRFIYDPSQQTIRFTGEELIQGFNGCYLLAVNDYEFTLIQNKTGLSEDKIRSMVGGLLITHGKEGSTLSIDGETYRFPVVPPKQVVEPTGAGDAFRAGLLRGMELGLPWDVCGRMGALAATYVLEQFGTQNHRFDSAEFVARFRLHFDDKGALDILTN